MSLFSFSRFVSFLMAAVGCLGSSLCGAEWRSISVPGSWEKNAPSVASQYDGIVWYRTWVKVHDSFFTRHDRNLFEESVSVNIRELADAHDVYVNGVKVGTGGEFPPHFKSGRTEIHRHKVPVGTLRKGEWNEIAIRIYNPSGPGGFLGEAPFIMNYFMECVLEGAWQFSLGDDYRPGGALRDRPGTSSFDQFRESNRVLGRSSQFVTGPKLSPEDSFAKMKSASDLAVDLLLSEPLVAQPTHISFDERGRMWVSQYRQYPYPAGVNMISRDKYYRSHYDAVPPPPPNHARGEDIVSIHEDTDGDGVYDRSKVFQGGLNMVNAAVRGRGGVWMMNTPYLVFYPDKNGDDIPDGPPVVHLQGFGLEDTHAVANGLIWGPDGWLYGAQGSSTSCRVTRVAMDPPDSEGVYFEGSMVWRYHPETRAFEIFAEGSGNTFGLEMDAQGRFYSGQNGGNTRGWHYVQGGFYLMQGVDPGKFGPPRNPYAFGDLPMLRTLNPVRRFSHFMAVVEGTALPAKYQGHFFSVDPLHNEIIDSERNVVGSTFETKDVGRPMWSDDVAFRPLFIVNAPDGSLFVSDMYEYYIAHGQHYQSQIDPSTGRIYRLRGTDLPLNHDTDLEKKSSVELVALLNHPNKWHRTTAAFVLGERRDLSVVASLRALLEADKELGSMTALWALQQMGQIDDALLRKAFSHSYAPVRMWAVRILGDHYGVNRGLGLPPLNTRLRKAQASGSVGIGASQSLKPEAIALGGETKAALLALAKNEKNAEVRSQLAMTARRLSTNDALALVPLLASHDEDDKDAYIPLLIWWVLEAHMAIDRPAVLAVFNQTALWDRPLVQEHILPRLMRRFALEGRRQDLLICAQLLRLAPSPHHAAILVAGFQEAYRGRTMVGLPDELTQALQASGNAPLPSRVRLGSADAVQEALSILNNPKAKVDDRVSYARIFGEIKAQEALNDLLTIATSKEPVALRKAALVALAAFDQPEIGTKVAEMLTQTSGEVRTAAFSLLASRASWSLSLVKLVEGGQVAANEIPADTLDRIRVHESPILSDLMAKVFPAKTSTDSSGNFGKRIAEIEAVLKQQTGNPYAGEQIYLDRCAACHKLFFKGGRVGPDLTNYQRDNLSTMLLSIINPNVEVREGFQYYLVETRDGRSLSGFLVERDTQVVVLRGLDGEDIVLRAGDITKLQPTGRSLMPEGLLDGLDNTQLRDLFAYLRISQPISR